MTTSPRAPDHICQFISYRIDEEGPRLEAPESLFDELTQVDFPLYIAEIISLELVDGLIKIGTKVPGTISMIADFFGKSDATAVNEGQVHPKVLGSRTANEGPRLKYPFQILEQIGDFFLVEEGDLNTVSNYTTNYKKYMAPEKVFTVRKIPGGILVLLLFSPTAIIRDSQKVTS